MEQTRYQTNGRYGPGGSETLLIVDDEEAVLRVVSELLSRHGYQVLTASTGREALKVYLENRDRIRLVSLDLLMPEMSGQNLLQTLLRMNPALKTIVVSGATFEGKVEDALRAGARAVVEKPFDSAQLLKTVREVLDS